MTVQVTEVNKIMMKGLPNLPQGPPIFNDQIEEFEITETDKGTVTELGK